MERESRKKQSEKDSSSPNILTIKKKQLPPPDTIAGRKLNSALTFLI